MSVPDRAWVDEAERLADALSAPGVDEQARELAFAANRLVAEVRRQDAALARVRGLHQATGTVPLSCEDFTGCSGTGDQDCGARDADEHEVPACAECRVVHPDHDTAAQYAWPCPTALAVDPGLADGAGE